MRLVIVVFLLPFLATGTMAGGGDVKKANMVCSTIDQVKFKHLSSKVYYEFPAKTKAIISDADCRHIEALAEGEFRNADVGQKAEAVRVIHNWVCSNLRAASGRRDISYIANEFYDTLTTRLREAYRSMAQLAQLGELKAVDALDLFAASATQAKLPALLTDVVTRLPCFCRLLKLMMIKNKATRKANSAMCHSILATPGKPSVLDTYGAADVRGSFWDSSLTLLPSIRLTKFSSCREQSLTAEWEPEDRDNWFACAATYMVNDYEVLLVPKGLMMYHGSRTLPPGVVPDGMTWFGPRDTAEEYEDMEWGEHSLHRDKPVLPGVHAFEAIKHMFVVRLMVRKNSKAMLDDLPEGLNLRRVTGFPAELLYRDSRIDDDRRVFGALCPKWEGIGIAGYAESTKDFHAEMMLCNSHGSVMPVAAASA